MDWWQNTDGKENDFYESDHFKSNEWNQERFSATKA
jgi:hypothetical protein